MIDPSTPSVAGSRAIVTIRHTALILAVSMALLPGISSADVYQYAVSRQLVYQQNSNAQPTVPDFWALGAFLYYDVPNEVLTATVELNVPPIVSHSLSPSIATLHQYVSTFFTSESEFAADFPETTYTLTADRGAGIETGSLFVAADLFCPEVPHFTGDTYSRLQNCDSALDFNGTLNGFTLPPGTDTGYCHIAVVEVETSAAFTMILESGDIAFQIPESELKPDTSYSISMDFLTVVTSENAGFGSATAQAIFVRGTTAYFTTAPAQSACCRADINSDGQIDAMDIQGFVDALLTGQQCP